MTDRKKSGRKKPIKRRSKKKGGSQVGEECLEGTGVFKGLKIPAKCRGKYVLIANGKVRASSRSIGKLLRDAKASGNTPVIIEVPPNDHVVAAY